VNRREYITLLGGAAAWPLAARAQQPGKLPTVGFLVPGTPATLPAVYFERFFITGGGLISYGPDFPDQYRLAAGYVDRILKGEKPAELPVQAPTKYELVINLKTAKNLKLDIPTPVFARADEVIE